MKLKLIASLLIVGLLGCGQVEEHAIYDTANNPNNYPAPAIDLLISMESGQLSSTEAITTAFGDLYTHHSELLDNEDWKLVIERLGGQFDQTADSLKALGAGAYTSAAEFYQLASFARPDDPTFRRQAALFATWLTGLQDSLIDLSTVAGEATPELTDLVDVTRYFLESDPAHREFYQTYLTEPMKQLAGAHDLFTTEALEPLSQTDRELLITAGLTTP
jgi:hypothetical protein